jgi:cell division protein FtsW (lipid II flippase)
MYEVGSPALQSTYSIFTYVLFICSQVDQYINLALTTKMLGMTQPPFLTHILPTSEADFIGLVVVEQLGTEMLLAVVIILFLMSQLADALAECWQDLPSSPVCCCVHCMLFPLNMCYVVSCGKVLMQKQ